MAKLARPFDTATVMALRGSVDLYYWKGIPVARSWPRQFGHRPVSTSEQKTRNMMGAVAPMTGAIDPALRQAYIDDMAVLHPQGVTWVDMFRSVAMVGRTWFV